MRRSDFYTTKEVGEILGRSDYTIRRWITEKKLKPVYKDTQTGRILIPKKQIDALVIIRLQEEEKEEE